MWAQRVKREDRGDQMPLVTIEAFPAECSRCGPDNRARFGCGHDARYAGRAALTFLWAKEFACPDVRRTCPRYYAETGRDVAAVVWELEDYARGALGPVGALPAPMVTYLRVAEIERQRWRDKQMDG